MNLSEEFIERKKKLAMKTKVIFNVLIYYLYRNTYLSMSIIRK